MHASPFQSLAQHPLGGDCVPTARAVWHCAGGVIPLSLGDLFNFYTIAAIYAFRLDNYEFQSPLYSDRSCDLALRWGLGAPQLGGFV